MNAEKSDHHEQYLGRAGRGKSDKDAEQERDEDPDIGDQVQQAGKQAKKDSVLDAHDQQGHAADRRNDGHFKKEALDILPDPGLHLRDDIIYGFRIRFFENGDEEPDDQPSVEKEEKSIDQGKDDE